MKKLFTMLGVAFACLMALGVVFVAVIVHNGKKLDTESKAYVDRTVPLVVTSWDVKELLNNASPEFIHIVPEDKLNSMFQMFSDKLGGLKEYKGSTGDSLVSFTNKEKMTTATYNVQLAFEKADAMLIIRLIKHEDKWQIMDFFVSSPAFMP